MGLALRPHATHPDPLKIKPDRGRAASQGLLRISRTGWPQSMYSAGFKPMCAQKTCSHKAVCEDRKGAPSVHAAIEETRSEELAFIGCCNTR